VPREEQEGDDAKGVGEIRELQCECKLDGSSDKNEGAEDLCGLVVLGACGIRCNRCGCRRLVGGRRIGGKQGTLFIRIGVRR
jgi:hypothetical protein